MIVRRDLLLFAITVTLCLSSTFTHSDTLTWDSTPGGEINDGGGVWLNTGQWNDGSPSATWDNGVPDNAIIGNGGNGGTISLGTVSAGTVSLDNFSGTYVLSGGSLNTAGGITIGTTAGAASLLSPISGAGGVTVNSPGTVRISSSGSYTGPTVVNNGILKIGGGWSDTWTKPCWDLTNLEINDGTIEVGYYGSRSLGSGPGQIQLTGGTCGFINRQGDAGGNMWTVNGSASYEIVWGSQYFKPDVLLIQHAAGTDNGGPWGMPNPIDLNGADRTIASDATGLGSYKLLGKHGQLSGVIRNTGSTPAGIIKTGPGELRLTAVNTYDGDTTVKGGLLVLNVANPGNDASTVTIADGAKLKLNFSGSDNVARLILGNKTMPAGEYGHTNSGADNAGAGVGAMDAYFESGSGKLISRYGPSGMVLLIF